jgi:uncharacterized protein YdeI (YjbR/CyaY-like superfamily)
MPSGVAQVPVHLGVHHLVAHARHLPFADGTFDVIATEPPYHKKASTLVAEAMQELYRVLKPGRRLVMLCATSQANALRRQCARLGLRIVLDAAIDRKDSMWCCWYGSNKRSSAGMRSSEEPMKPTFFATPSEFRRWLEEHHDATQEVWVGFHKKSSGKPSITWPEAVDEALCFGWIDGVRKGIDDVSYTIRFTPRKPRSIWSAVSVKRARELAGLGLMRTAGLKAFEERAEEKSGLYAYEQQFRANKKAWDFFQAQAAWYRRAAIWWVISAKKEETRLKRLATLIEDPERGRTIPPLTRRTKLE